MFAAVCDESGGADAIQEGSSDPTEGVSDACRTSDDDGRGGTEVMYGAVEGLRASVGPCDGISVWEVEAAGDVRLVIADRDQPEGCVRFAVVARDVLRGWLRRFGAVRGDPCRTAAISRAWRKHRCMR